MEHYLFIIVCCCCFLLLFLHFNIIFLYIPIIFIHPIILTQVCTFSDDGMTLENYIEHEESAEFDAFGADILQDFNLYSLECSMNVSKVELKYEIRLGHLLTYYSANKKAMKTKNFESLTNQTRQDVEKNIRNTIHTVEREKVAKVVQAKKTCQEKIQKHLEGKMVKLVNQAKHSVRRNPSAFERLLTSVRLFQSRLYSHKRACGSPGDSEKSTVTCDGHSLQLLLNFTSSLISRMDYVRDVSYSDDEDLSSSRVGSGEDLDGREESSTFKQRTTPMLIELANQTPDTETPPQTTPHQFESSSVSTSQSIKDSQASGDQLDETTPTPDETTPILDETTPILDETTPIRDETTPILGETTPILDETTPILDATTPILDETTPILDETTPILDETTPILDDTTVLILDRTTQGACTNMHSHMHTHTFNTLLCISMK